MTTEQTLSALHAAAYKQWEQNEGLGFEELLAQLPAVQRYAVVLGDFHFQVSHGGFTQWERNQYSLQFPDLVKIVAGMPETDAVREVDSILHAYQQNLLGEGDEDLMDLTLRYLPISDAFFADANAWVLSFTS